MGRRKGTQAAYEPTLADLAWVSPTGLAHADMGERYIPGRFASHLNNVLMDIERGKIDRVIVQVPPRTGKSTLCSQYFPAWYLGHHPDRRVMLGSYSDRLATKFGRDARDTLRRWGPTVFGPDATVRDDVSAKGEWELTGGGGMLSTGIEGGQTGRGANVLVVDDPTKNPEEAHSRVIQDKIWDWYLGAAVTRQETPFAVIIVMTRWSEDDLVGRVLQQEKRQKNEGEPGEGWVLIDCPAVALENDMLGRKPGEALFPERYPIERLMRIKRALGSYFWNALYQQRPAPPEGSIFKREWFQYFDIEERPNGTAYFVLYDTRTGNPDAVRKLSASSCYLVQFCDTAQSEKETADFFVVSTWAVTPQRELLLLDVFRQRSEVTKHKPAVLAQYHKWKPFNLKFVGVEKKNEGSSLIGDLKGKIPVRPVPAELDKVSRAQVISAKYEAAEVYHLAGAGWLGDWEAELVAFPRSTHDDQVDTASMAGIHASLVERRKAGVYGPSGPVLTRRGLRFDLLDRA